MGSVQPRLGVPSSGEASRSPLGMRAPCASRLRALSHSDLRFQFSYHNFDRSRHDDDDIRGCAVLDLASLQWVAMQCETQLDWICKIPRGWVGWLRGTGNGAKGPGRGSEGGSPFPAATLSTLSP